MYICSCRAVTDHQIRDYAKKGADWRELVQATEVATQCGRCARGAKAEFDRAVALLPLAAPSAAENAVGE